MKEKKMVITRVSKQPKETTVRINKPTANKAEELIKNLFEINPVLTTVIVDPASSGIFDQMSKQENNDCQNIGERNFLLSKYFENIANTIIFQYTNNNQSALKKLITNIYNTGLSQLIPSFIAGENVNVDAEMVKSFARILLCESFTYNNNCYDSYSHQLNRHPKESVDMHDLVDILLLTRINPDYYSRIYDIRYYLLHSNNFMELALALVTVQITELSSQLSRSLSRIKTVNLTEDETIALDSAWTIIGHIFSKYSMELLEGFVDLFNTLALIANEIDAGGNIVNLLPRSLVSSMSTIPVDFGMYLEMEKKARKYHLGKSVGFIVDGTESAIASVRENLYKEE